MYGVDIGRVSKSLTNCVLHNKISIYVREYMIHNIHMLNKKKNIWNQFFRVTSHATKRTFQNRFLTKDNFDEWKIEN